MYPELFSIGPVTVYTYGVLLAASYLLGLQFAIARARRWKLDTNRVLDLGIYIIIAALVGAKLLLVITDFDQFRASPAELLSLARSGGVFYGGPSPAAPRRSARHGLRRLDIAIHFAAPRAACHRDVDLAVADDAGDAAAHGAPAPGRGVICGAARVLGLR